MEILVLIIFRMFNSSITGPLMVLYKFLDYFGKFDWENNCISLNGPVSKSSLPGQKLETEGDIMGNCVEMFTATSGDITAESTPFRLKDLNIIDPLKKGNNLGRSVNRENYGRICEAFKSGAHSLGRILQSPQERIEDDIKMFFATTIEKHGHIDVAEGFRTSSSSSHTQTFSDPSKESLTVDLWIEHEEDIWRASDVMGRDTIYKCVLADTDLWLEYEEDNWGSNDATSVYCNCGDSLSTDSDKCVSDNTDSDIEPLNPLADLNGNYDRDLLSLLYARNTLSDEAKGQSALSPFLSSTPSTAHFRLEDGYFNRGTGTYFPDVNFLYSVWENTSQGRGWNQTPVTGTTQWRTKTSKNGSVNAPLPEANSQLPVNQQYSSQGPKTH